MPVIDENRVLGNFGSNLVAHLLSHFCLVRPVAEGTDIGVDLYCETIENRQGFLHFWVQVKCGGEQITLLKQNDKASCAFKIDHLRYWDRQPVPVFGFYVPTGYPPSMPDNIFIANITEYLINYGIPSGDTKTIESHFKITPSANDWYDKFQQRIRETTALIKLRDDGIISALPELEPGYLQQLIQFPKSSRYAKESLRTIRLTVSSLVADAAQFQQDPPKEFFAERLVKILQLFEEGERPEIMRASALWNANIERNPGKAWEMVNVAFKSIDSDRNLSESIKKNWKESFKPVLEIIKDIEDSLGKKMSNSRSVKVKYLDTSAIVKLYLDEDGSSNFREYFHSHTNFCTAIMTFYESMNVLKSRLFNGQNAKKYHDAVEDLAIHGWGGKIEIEPVALDKIEIFKDVSKISIENNLDIADAVQIYAILKGKYSFLARDSSSILITADEGQELKATRLGIRVWNCRKESAPEWMNK